VTVYTVGFCPPSTMKLLSVIQAARSEMRNPTISARSCGTPIRPKGIAAVMISGQKRSVMNRLAQVKSHCWTLAHQGITFMVIDLAGCMSSLREVSHDAPLHFFGIFASGTGGGIGPSSVEPFLPRFSISVGGAFLPGSFCGSAFGMADVLLGDSRKHTTP
jgi:hypothetical protein